MALHITWIIIVLLVGILLYKQHIKREKIRKQLEASLEDENLYVDGRLVSGEALTKIIAGDPEKNVKYTKDTMFRDDLMKFDGEFLIPGLPLNEERRLSIDDAFLYLQELFGADTVIKKPVLTHYDPIYPNAINDDADITSLAHKIAVIMDIDPDSIEIGFFEGGKAVDPATVDSSHESNDAAGLYYGKNEEGKYLVTLADNMHEQPERLIATIAHEFAHIKLLGEGRMDENSEELTDMVPLIYGFGLFNSNAVFNYSRDNTSWSTFKLGYLSQVDWAYLFALYLYVREEKDPEWLHHLNKTIAKDCKLAYDFIIANKDKVLQPQV